MRFSSRPFWLAVILCGCASTRSSSPVLTQDAASCAAPHSAVYKVVWISPDGRQMTVPHATAYLHKGEALGFKRDEQNRLLAVGGEYEFDVTPKTSAAKVAWVKAHISTAGRVDERHGSSQAPQVPDGAPGKREGIIETIVTDPGAFTR